MPIGQLVGARNWNTFQFRCRVGRVDAGQRSCSRGAATLRAGPTGLGADGVGAPGWWRLLGGGLDGDPRPDHDGRPRSQRCVVVPPGLGHLGPSVSVSVTLEVVEPPVVRRLYFWALQADFGDGGRPRWRRPPRAAVAPAASRDRPRSTGAATARAAVSCVGSTSPLPSALRNPNTRDSAWAAGTSLPARIERVDRPGTAPVGHDRVAGIGAGPGRRTR